MLICKANQELIDVSTLALMFSFAAAATFLTPSASTLSDVILSKYLQWYTRQAEYHR